MCVAALAARLNPDQPSEGAALDPMRREVRRIGQHHGVELER